MNFINKALLNLVLLPAPLYNKIGINSAHLKLILVAKLTMDDRRPNTFHQTRSRKHEADISGATGGTMVFCLLLGLLFLFSFFVSQNRVTQLTFYFSFFIFILTSILIADFTSVLIDVRDNYIILTRPVTGKTFVLSRLLHIFIHLAKLILPMSLPGFIYILIVNGLPAALVLLLIILFTTVFTIFVINVIYLVILKITSPQRFKRIISSVQVFMAIAVFASYQLLPQVIRQVALNHLDINQKMWIWLLPSYWFALGWEFFYSFQLQKSLIEGALLTLLVPPFTLWMVIKYFAPSFNQKLSLISGSGEESSSAKKRSAAGYHHRGWSQWLARISTKKGSERMGFLLTWNLTSRSRDFKLKVYPSIGYIFVYAAVMLVNKQSISLQELRDEAGSSRFIFITMIYVSSMLLILAINQLQYSDSSKAAWVYFTTPVARPGLILSGSLKAAILKFFAPLGSILSLTAILVIGIKLVPDLVLALSNVLVASFCLALLMVRNLPFSVTQNTSDKTGNFLHGLLTFLIPSSLGLLHYFVFKIKLVVFVLIILSVLTNWLLLDHIKGRKWEQVLAEYNEEL